MSGLNLRTMRIELIKGGVAPKIVRRTLEELTAHYDDLKNQAMNEGLSEREANDKARAAIGDEQEILKAILGKPELKSMVSRFPKIVFLFGPLLMNVFAVILLLLGLAIIASYRSWFGAMDAGINIPIWDKVWLEGLLAFNCYLVTPLLALGSVLLAKQRLVNFYWPAVGIVLLTIMGSGWAYTLVWPTELAAGTLQINWGYSFLPRAIRGDHDLKNFLQIFTTLALAAIVWRVYWPLNADWRNSHLKQ